MKRNPSFRPDSPHGRSGGRLHIARQGSRGPPADGAHLPHELAVPSRGPDARLRHWGWTRQPFAACVVFRLFVRLFLLLSRGRMHFLGGKC